MALKRKRSSPSFDTSAVPSSHSPLHAFYHHSKPAEPLYHKHTWAFPTYSESEETSSSPSANTDTSSSPSTTLHGGNASGRTRKRHRDDRPDERQVFASTMQRLYAAQRERPNAQPLLSSSQVSQASPPPEQLVSPQHQQDQPQQQQQKSTLHSFWQIPGERPRPASQTMTTVIDPVVSCEDCGGPLKEADGMDLDDGMMEVETACGICSSHVCDTCAVLSDQRVCLGCAILSRRNL